MMTMMRMMLSRKSSMKSPRSSRSTKTQREHQLPSNSFSHFNGSHFLFTTCNCTLHVLFFFFFFYYFLSFKQSTSVFYIIGNCVIWNELAAENVINNSCTNLCSLKFKVWLFAPKDELMYVNTNKKYSRSESKTFHWFEVAKEFFSPFEPRQRLHKQSDALKWTANRTNKSFTLSARSKEEHLAAAIFCWSLPIILIMTLPPILSLRSHDCWWLKEFSEVRRWSSTDTFSLKW